MLKYALLLVLPILAQDALRGSWGAEFRGDQVHLNIRFSRGSGSSNWGRTYNKSELSDVVRSGDAISFKLVRAPGVFVFRGTEDDRQGGGTWTFTPNASYVQQLEKLGYTNLDTREHLFVFAVCDLSIDDVKYMETSTGDKLTAARLVKLCNHGVTPEYVRALSAAGYKNLDSEELLRARDHGVTSEYISEMRALGFKLALDDLVKTRDHGVDAEFVRDFSGFGDLTASHYVKLRDHGVDGEFAKDVRELGYKDVEPDELIKLRDHGVTISYIKRVNREHSRRLDLGEVIRLRDHAY
ncbi:MAG TPA: hypothetical protein VM100_07010 [Longimicrobiales bacterium]|nr:hypothetical protein [Longimicrobiales bacterium]